ncbi:MAG: N-acetylmuramoyl-L-alanine amidase [Armatimonadetes bacterium]|nr:N-acetylmuramoyl-L-alanine amidase [Armatimonadota bacterium]
MPKSELLVLDPQSNEFEAWLTRPGFRRPVATVLHHTWVPAAAQYRGRQTIVNVEAFHMKPVAQGGRGWRAIGANGYATPEGKVVTGRNLSYDDWAHAKITLSKPESEARKVSGGQAGWFNRNAYGLETVANFDSEPPYGDGPAARSFETAMRVLTTVHRVFGIPADRLFFHRDVADKSCPGERLAREAVRADLAARLGEAAPVAKVVLDGAEVACAPMMVGDRMTVEALPFLAALGVAPGPAGPFIHANGRAFVGELAPVCAAEGWELAYRSMPQGPRLYVKRAQQ